jgi:outer membrane protein assembly factor BamB
VEVDSESWRADVPDPWVQTLAFPSDGVVLYATQSGEVCAHDPADGTQTWCTEIDPLRDAEPRLLAQDATTVVVVTPRQVIALDQATGRQRWTFEPPQPLTAAAAVNSSDVIVVDRRGRAQALALDSGEPRWRSPRLGDVTAVVASDDDFYVGTEAGSVVCVRPTVAAG